MAGTDYFSIYELYYLIGAFDGDTLLGLPGLDELSLPSEAVWEIAHESLKAKGLVGDDDDLTKAGFAVVETLKDYCTGYSLTVINNAYVMLTGNHGESVILIDSQEGYQLLRLGPLARLAFFQEKLPSLFLREPQADERHFLTKEEALSSAIEAKLAGDDTVVIQHYPLRQMLESKHRDDLVVSWLFREIDGHLYGFETSKQVLQRFSQYYFLERCYTWLAIPFREEDFA
ncbi:DUF5081 family protein [Streptococcus suis]|uniref:DUF5081 family protein n=1 Tax=Streptococcus suis TaxID=1307 RepID=UPI000C19D9A3|nr:DUF5081 family protein [Streptococcus suis]MBY5005638.1 DUF5081 family protein [Streptococcus suis]